MVWAVNSPSIAAVPAAVRMSSRTKMPLQCDGRLGALVRADFGVERGDDFGGSGLDVAQIGGILQKLARDSDARPLSPLAARNSPSRRSCKLSFPSPGR